MTALVIESGKHRGKRFNLPAKECVIGRQEGCAIRLTSGDVSKMHCALQATADGLVVRDLGSRNGTFVNDAPVTGPTLVKPGDTIRVGPMTFRAVASSPAAKSAAAKSAAAKSAAAKSAAGTARAADAQAPSGPKARRAAKSRPSQPEQLSEDDIAALLTDDLDSHSGDTTLLPGAASAADEAADASAAGTAGADAGAGDVESEVVRRAAAIIQRWHHDHPNGG